jgi:hypothetical protein
VPEQRRRREHAEQDERPVRLDDERTDADENRVHDVGSESGA